MMQAQASRFTGTAADNHHHHGYGHGYSQSSTAFPTILHTPTIADPAAPDHSDDGAHHSGDGDGDDLDNDDDNEEARLGKRKRPISVSCELCKQRKVKCDRAQPACGWCSRNNANCEYKERKKPGLRAGYGRELEQRLDKLETKIRQHEESLRIHEENVRIHADLLQTLTNNSSTSGGDATGPSTSSHHRISTSQGSVKGSHTSLSSDRSTPREPALQSIFSRTGSDPLRISQAETVSFLQRSSRSVDFGLPAPVPTVGSAPGFHDGYRGMSAMSPRTHLPPLLGHSSSGPEYYARAAPSLAPIHSPPALPPPQPRQMSIDQDLPPYDMLHSLVEIYFKHINTWCPILHRKSTFDSLFGPARTSEVDKIVLHAIVATSLRYSTDERLTDESRQRYHEASKRKVLLYGMENLSVKSLQALVILALDLCGSGNGPPGWNIMAIITRAVVQLGLAVESNSLSVAPTQPSIYTLRAMILPEPQDFVEEESRRRLFWMVYLLDRYATIATAFEFALDDREIDRTLPCRDELWFKNQKVETRWFHAELGRISRLSLQPGDNPENLGAFGHYVEILSIFSKIHTFLKQPVDIAAPSDVERWKRRYKDLDSMLATWKFNLTGEYGNMAKMFQAGSAKNVNCSWVMLHATYHTAVIRLHSSAAYPTTRSEIFTSSYSAAQRCHQAVENIAALGEFVINHWFLAKLGPPFAFTLWVAARVLLVHGSTVENQISPRIRFFVDTLREMGRYWPVAARYCNLLSRVLDEHRENEQQGGSDTPNIVKILADMRRTAFDLDFLISRQPRHVPGGVDAGHGHGSAVGHGGGWHSRVASVTPSRTPATNELDSLDMFDFFNMPKLSIGPQVASADMNGPGVSTGLSNMPGPPSAHGIAHGEFNNITDFMMDASRDWLFQQGETKFMA
ncbi:fungal-specific transcription factor domain-containing protein [Podospora fimiseda]|uniref:Fungal-specific transcription factor domain-containing protein n=1 Tax=Podospora fimiseda TaxID=252190 RepID=A0AAN7BHC2_9PEZI|nr:fungal-specific transcription factor domain-containing protein [Podospora fimiseda]